MSRLEEARTWLGLTMRLTPEVVAASVHLRELIAIAERAERLAEAVERNSHGIHDRRSCPICSALAAYREEPPRG